jgi:hypothetical protein
LSQKARCISCRVDITVPDSYAQGDHIKCGSCGTQHKIIRGESLKLVLADVGPLKDALRQNHVLIERLENDLAAARGSFGMGVNGLGIALIYVLWQVGQKDRMFERALLWEALALAVASGLLLELANYLFLAKRMAMGRLSDEIDAARADAKQLEQKIREGSRV